MQKLILRGSLFISLVLFLLTPSFAAASTLLDYPPIDLGYGIIQYDPQLMNGLHSGFSFVATSSFSFDQVSQWECVNNGISDLVARVYKGNPQALVEVASSSPIRVAHSCPGDIFQHSYLVTQDEWRDTLTFPAKIDVTQGERITIFFEQINKPLPSAYLVVGVRPTPESGDVVGKTSLTTALVPALGWSPLSPFYPAYQLGLTEQGCTVECYSNVLFLPGIEASRLYDISGNEIWLSDNDT